MITRKIEQVNIDDAFFAIEEQPIYSSKGIRIPGYKTIVDRGTGRSLSVVSDKYCIIHNIEAYEWGDFVVKEVFGDKTIHDFTCYNIHMPQTKASCRIDLIIPNNFNVLFGDAKESWTPFLRISNSYNRLLALKYEMGFCRWICQNGMIFGQTGVSLSVSHNGRITLKDIEGLIEVAKKKMGTIGTLWKSFEMKMEYLRGIPIPSSLALEIYCKVFEVKIKKNQVTHLQQEGLLRRAKQVTELEKEYFEELGNNAYAMMNVLTDCATFPKWTNQAINYIHGYQRRVGRWVDDFTTQYKKTGFHLDEYIGDECRDTACYLRKILETETMVK